LADERTWPALRIESAGVADLALEEAVAALVDDFSPVAVQDLSELPLPPGGLWDPTFPPPPDPPPSPLRWRVFFTTAADRDRALQALQAAHSGLDLAAEDIADEDWAARSQRSLTAVRSGRFVVAPPWDVPPAGDATVIIIEPSRGFGTGHHASTRLCLRALSDVEVRGARVLDLGTGSGVLAMAAFLSGAREVVAVDIDPDAIDSARESARLNQRVGPIAWLLADFRDPGWDLLSGGPFDLVLANLTGGMLISSAARVGDLIKPGGTLICSGFDQSERPAVEQALGISAAQVFVEDGWVGLICRA
jgi:ribosomal protein L11 methyltransferase